MARIGYARLSSADPNPEVEIEALNAAGVQKVFIDRSVRRVTSSHPQLDACLRYLRKGDQLVVLKTNRFGGIVASLFYIDFLNKRGVQLKSLTEPVSSLNTKTGLLKCRLVVTVDISKKWIVDF